MEITFRTPAAAEAIARISREVPGMLVGAGTLLTPEQAQAAGVDYMVIGRPVTQSADPAATLRSINASLTQGV